MKATLRVHLAWIMLLVSCMPLLAQTRIDSDLRNSAIDGPSGPGLKTRPAQSSAARPLKPAHVVEKSDARARVGAAATVETFSYSGSIVTWTVPTNVYQLTIEARGAEGGNHGASEFGPGQGASIKGTVAVTPGDVLKILVGQQGAENGGGGGTFVTTNTNKPLMIAGGGGGSGDVNDSGNKHGQSGSSGGTGAGGGGAGGTAGNGGIGGRGAGGGGLLTDGSNSGGGTNIGGGAFVNGGSGGGGDGGAVGGFGGFGGGGGGSGWVSGGGGGGYSGGGGADVSAASVGGVGGGGGSFNGGTNKMNTAGANSGNGLVTITYTEQDIRCGTNGQNVLICYYGTTQCVNKKTAERYLKLGATMGPCNSGSSAARLGVEEAGELGLALQAFPNPVQDLVTLEVRAPQAGPATFSVLDLTGRTRQSRTEELTEGLNEVEFRLGTLPTGTYLIRAIDALGRQGTTRVSKQ